MLLLTVLLHCGKEPGTLSFRDDNIVVIREPNPQKESPKDQEKSQNDAQKDHEEQVNQPSQEEGRFLSVTMMMDRDLVAGLLEGVVNIVFSMGECLRDQRLGVGRKLY